MNMLAFFDNIIFIQSAWFFSIPAIFIIYILYLVSKTPADSETRSEPASLLKGAAGKNHFYHPFTHFLPAPLHRHKRNYLITAGTFAIVILIITSLAEPVRVGKKLQDPPEERDIVFIVDTSVSMILRDYVLNDKRIDRMSLLKVMLDNFIQKLQGERIGIIVFGDTAHTLVPLTRDQALLQKMVTRIQSTMAGRFNAIGEGIALGVKQAKQHSINNITRKRVLVLLTDADQPTGKIEPVTAAQFARKENLPLYTIAIGSTGLTEGAQQQNDLLYSAVNLSLVKKLAAITQAKSYHAKNSYELDEAIKDITKHETNKQQVKPRYYYQPLYYFPLIAAIILFSLIQAVTLYRSSLI